MCQRLYSQKTSHISPSQASYGVSLVRIWVKIDRVVTTPQCKSRFLKIDKTTKPLLSSHCLSFSGSGTRVLVVCLTAHSVGQLIKWIKLYSPYLLKATRFSIELTLPLFAQRLYANVGQIDMIHLLRNSPEPFDAVVFGQRTANAISQYGHFFKQWGEKNTRPF